MPESVTYKTTRFFEQAMASAKLMAEMDEKLDRFIAELEAEGNTLVSITYDY